MYEIEIVDDFLRLGKWSQLWGGADMIKEFFEGSFEIEFHLDLFHLTRKPADLRFSEMEDLIWRHISGGVDLNLMAVVSLTIWDRAVTGAVSAVRQVVVL